jgi:hypothetical protein
MKFTQIAAAKFAGGDSVRLRNHAKAFATQLFLSVFFALSIYYFIKFAVKPEQYIVTHGDGRNV